MRIYSETGKKLAEAELWYVDPCHHTDEECFQRVINSATRSPADLWRFMSKLNIHITNQPSVKSGEPEDSGNFGKFLLALFFFRYFCFIFCFSVVVVVVLFRLLS